MEYISAREAADKWGISQRRVATLCSENRITDATMVGNMWIIPNTAEKPVDARSIRYTETSDEKAKPFLKWAGGKGQLLNEIKKYYPFNSSEITKFAEPFVGGGAVLFDILNKYDLKDVYISDNNPELINTYTVVRDNVDYLIEILSKYQQEYLSLDTDERKVYYFAKREHFNDFILSKSDAFNIKKAALMIFLNRTCFNGLYRVNKKGLFNVPMGSYKNPLICDEKNLCAVSEKLQNIEIVCGDFKKSANFIDEHTFVYFDPPYRPLNSTSDFTSYTETAFNDANQIELAEFINEMSKKGARILTSNSDPKNADPEDTFFDDLYNEYNIVRTEAIRAINSNSNSRGKIKELLISNF